MSSAPALVPRPTPLTLAQKVVGGLVFALVVAAVLGVGWLLRFLVTPLALAILGFYCLAPVVNALENRGLPRWGAVLLCFGTLAAILVALGAAIWPSLRDWLAMQPDPVGTPSAFEVQLAKRLEDWEAAGRRAYPKLDWTAMMLKVHTFLDEQRKGLTETMPRVAISLASNAGTFVLAPIITLFLLIDGARMHRAVLSLLPNRHFETALLLLHRVDRQIAGYLRGAASECALVTLLLAAALWVAGMPNPLLFAALYGVLNVIPLLGPVLGTSAALLYSLMDPTSPPPAVLLACFGSVYVVDAMFINPLVIGKNLNLHPLTIILGVSIGGALGDVLGMLASIPLIAISKAIILTVWDAYRRGQLLLTNG